MRFSSKKISIIICSLAIFTAGCKNTKKDEPLFEAREAAFTGLQFTNTLTPDSAFNMFKYMYFYNGAGVGAADFNGDGNTDIFFSSNQGQNTLYLGNGDLTFTDVTQQAGIPNDGGWSTGVSVADVNNDGLNDIYICRVGNFETLQSKNQLLICTGVDEQNIPHFTDSAAAYGLDFSGFSTQAVFFDYDLDGDLDMYLMNHAVHHSGMFAERARFLGTYSQLSGDKFYRNDNGRYIDATKETGINSSEIGYGLGAVVTDVNLDGLPDLYIGNDFHENDYLYINKGDGTFTDEMNERILHTSQYSMGVDAADINNDAFPEIVSMDMLPRDPYILKRSLGEDAYDIFKMKVRYGYNHQYTRNNLQYNMGNGYFSETGLYAGIYATDWSWAPLWMDFNHDGLKDLFISNGIPKRLNDMDYVSFVSNDAYQDKIRNNAIGQRELSMIEQFPEIKLPNHFFINKGESAFDEVSLSVKGNKPTYSNGAAYADFDNDGDLDVIVSNIGDAALLYENKIKKTTATRSLMVTLKGNPGNVNAIGSRLFVFSNDKVLLAEKQAVRGFQSSMEGPLHLGLGNQKIDSAWLVWPDNSYQRLTIPNDSSNTKLTFSWQQHLPAAPLQKLAQRMLTAQVPMTDVTAASGIDFVHHENAFIEFDREPLLPRMLSTEGPALAVADINGDGLDDVFVGGARNQVPGIWLQQADGRFAKSKQPAFEADSSFEDVNAIWADANKDGIPDLIVASGGNEFFGKDEHLLPRLYMNDGKGSLTRKTDAFTGLYSTWGAIAAQDINSDGASDLFIGGRAVPFAYGIIPPSYLLLNDGTGKFTDATAQIAPELSKLGFVTSATWNDLDKDGKTDLLISLEWGGLLWFRNMGGQFEKKEITTQKGWWQCMLPVDVNGDGFTDVIAGNLGLNSRLKASAKEPVRMYVKDMDGNDITEQVLTYYTEGREIPFANKDELMKQIPGLKKQYLYAGDFAKATLQELLGKENLATAIKYEATEFRNCVFINDGKGNFSPEPLPARAQWSNIRCALALPNTLTKQNNIWLGGNFYENNIQMGRYDADRGTILQPNGKRGFTVAYPPMPGITGQVRNMAVIYLGAKREQAVILAKNNEAVQLLKTGKNPAPASAKK